MREISTVGIGLSKNYVAPLVGLAQYFNDWKRRQLVTAFGDSRRKRQLSPNSATIAETAPVWRGL